MKWFARAVVVLVVLALAAGGLGMVQMMRSLPRLDGRLHVPGLQAPVQVTRDAADVVHIQAASAEDAWHALGFVHAQERGWQLEFNRRLMHGELSEILGPATLGTDKLMRTLGVMQVAKTQLAGLSAATRSALQAYSAGVTAAHNVGAAGHSPEFQLLRVRAGGQGGQPWTPEDSVAWSLMMALDLGGNWGNEAARFSLAQVLATEHLWQLMPPYKGEALATRVDLATLYRDLGAYASPGAAAFQQTPDSPLVAWANDWVRDAGTLDGKGSNNWVVPGSRTTSGKPLLANDPHLALSAPAIWYFAHLQAPAHEGQPALDVIGATLPGMPFVVLGRTAGVAWGFTNTGPDVQDLYLEQIDPAQSQRYRTPEGWQDFSVRPEIIRVKGQGDVQLQVRSTRHGPVISDVQPMYEGLLDKRRYAMALRWSALESDNRTLDAGMLANQAQTVAQLQAAYADHHSPMQSVVMADTQGQVAFKAIGRVPVRSAQNDLMGVAPAPGWIAAYDWTGWLPYDQTPALNHVEIEARGWHATANQRITPEGYPHFLTSDWNSPERFERIRQLLDTREKVNASDMARIQHDVFSLGAQAILPYALQARSRHPLASRARGLLQNFDGQMRRDSAAATILNVWAHELTQELVAPRIGEARFGSLYGKRHFRSGVEGMLARPDAFWCPSANCQNAMDRAMDKTLEQLVVTFGQHPAKWRWGDMHPAISTHRPFGSVPVLNRVFDERVASAGDLFTVNVGQYWASERQFPFANRHAASLRAIYDLADPEQSRFIYQTGQSGHPFDGRSRDMAQAWAGLSYRPLQRQPQTMRHRLELVP
jgi:penicillin G amidase